MRGGSTNLFTRQCQRDLWAEVYKCLENTNGSHAIVTGTPGIGKSRSMIYFLRLLLQNNKRVIFESRKDKVVYAFIPPVVTPLGKIVDQSYKVWKCQMKKWDTGGGGRCAVLKNPMNYYLIDMTKDSIHLTDVVAHTVLSALPRIFSQLKDFTHRTVPPLRFVMPVWKKEELNGMRQMRPYFPVSEKVLSEEDFQNRFICFGGRPRYVFTTEPDYSSQDVKKSVDDLTFPQLKSIILNPLIEPNLNIETGPSMIFAYVEKETNEKSKYKYEMKSINYTVVIASENILLQIVYKYWKELKDFLSPTGLYYQSNPLFCGHIFEAVAKILIQFGGKFTLYSCPARRDPVGILELMQESQLLAKGNSWLNYYEECSRLPSSSDTLSLRKAYIPNASNQPFIDMMDANDRAYQFTTAKSHSLNRKYLQQLLSCNSTVSEKNPLKIYYVVPKSRLGEFQYQYSRESDIAILERKGKNEAGGD